MISNSGDYGHFAGRVRGDSFALAHFDGRFVYMLTGAPHGDTLRGIFHAGLRTQTPWVAVRSTGAAHLKTPTEITTADTSAPFRFAFPDLEGRTGDRAGPAVPGQGACWWTCSEAGARRAMTRRRSSSGCGGSTTRVGSRSCSSAPMYSIARSRLMRRGASSWMPLPSPWLRMFVRCFALHGITGQILQACVFAHDHALRKRPPAAR